MKKLLSFLAIAGLMTACNVIENENPDSIIVESSKANQSQAFPDLIPLPDGFGPEGIASGNRTEFFVGSINTGAIYKGDYRSGSGSVLVEGLPVVLADVGGPGEADDFYIAQKIAVGLSYDARTDYLYVAAGFGAARVYDATTGDLVAMITLNNIPFPGTFINDVIVTKDAVYFTDSFQPVFYKVPLLPDGELPDPVTTEMMNLSGEYNFLSAPGTINSNGIVATPNGKNLIIGNLADGKLYLVDPETGMATLIDLGGEDLVNVDGLVLEGKTLYGVRNFNNVIAIVELNSDYSSGVVIGSINDPYFMVPTTAASFGSGIYAVNARFDVAPPTVLSGKPINPDISFDVVRVDKNLN